MTISRYGIVATSQTLASQAGAQVLARGGSAVDAAIAANATLGAVEPMMNGIGGDLFLIYWEAKTGKLTGLNASGWAPKDLTIEFLKSKGLSTMPQEGIQSVVVPGCVAGWEKLHKRFGRRPWAELFQPAIYYAEQGFPVTELIQDTWQKSVVEARRRRERAQDLPARRRPPARRRGFPQPTTGQRPAAHRAERRGRVLPRADRQVDPQDLRPARRQDDRCGLS